MKKIIVSLCLLFSLLVLSQDRSKATEIWLPNPTEVKTGEVTSFPPSDAIILLNGKNFSNWQTYSGEPPKWLINGDGSMEVINGTEEYEQESYGSVQLHIEWKTSKILKYKGQQRSNSGVFFQGRYEIQILIVTTIQHMLWPGRICIQTIHSISKCYKPQVNGNPDIIFVPQF